MSFSADWLRLREPCDAAARSPALARQLAEWSVDHNRLTIVDLGSGTGNLLSWLAPFLSPDQEWRLVERDPALIAAGRERLPAVPPWRYIAGDLADELDALLAPPVDIVVASALLDLVSRAWLERLVAIVRLRRTALLATLSFDGRVGFEPSLPLDQTIVALVNQHQHQDKGFGPALGPGAAGALAELLADAGGLVESAAADWRIDASSQAIQTELLRGYAAAAAEMPGAPPAAAIAAWLQARTPWVAAGRSTIDVGHRDLLWLPEPTGKR